MNRCIAYRDDGRICGAPAGMIDHQRGGMVCSAHHPSCANCPPGEERVKTYTPRIGSRPAPMVLYDYRTPAGRLFSCTAADVAAARTRRDEWLRVTDGGAN